MTSAHRPVLTRRDVAILRGLIGRHGAASDRRIAAKLAVARMVLPERIGRDIVTLNSRVVYAIEGAPPAMRIVVHSEALAVPGMTIPVHAPRGLALLGARAGDRIPVSRDDGRIETLTVLAVPYQPEAAAGLVVSFPPASATVLPLGRRAAR